MNVSRTNAKDPSPRLQVVPLRYLGFAPGAKVYRVQRDAEQVGGNEAELRRPESDQAENYAIHGGKNPTLPTAPPHQNRGTDGKNAGQIIKPK